jgi:hypothetical protein
MEISTLEILTSGGAVGLSREEEKGEKEKRKGRHGGGWRGEGRRIVLVNCVIWDSFIGRQKERSISKGTNKTD